MQYKIFTPTEYIEILNEGLSGFSAVLEGEISEYKVSQGKWIFFKVKDENSVLDCFSTVFQLKTPLEDGMQVRLYGTPKIHAKSGRFSLNVAWVEASGEGALKRAFELLKAELQKEGLFSEERKRKIPDFPKKIGIIASKESAAYKDFVKVLSERFGGMELYLYDVSVQGENSVFEIQEAFEYFNQNQKRLGLDLIVLTRGGGSLEDLKSFNSREVAYAIFGSCVPVVCGVGHEQDTTIADMVADLRASTPSNAAELISPQKEDVLHQIKSYTYKIESLLDFLLSEKKKSVNDFVFLLEGFLSGKVSEFKNIYFKFLSEFKLFEAGIKRYKENIESLKIQNLKIIKEKIIIQKSEIDAYLRLLLSLSPKEVLKRGYSIVKLKGKVVSSHLALKKGDKVDVTLAKGGFSSEVLNIKK